MTIQTAIKRLKKLAIKNPSYVFNSDMRDLIERAEQQKQFVTLIKYVIRYPSDPKFKGLDHYWISALNGKQKLGIKKEACQFFSSSEAENVLNCLPIIRGYCCPEIEEIKVRVSEIIIDD